ncbi:hypothetical protein ABT383_29535 [Streptomyces humidus]|uniref:hypothetical protein n=1 Tax=Streptomyces humidus TaxID=52259 RepID=UPI001E2C243F|nr:hypothetical protein [Streptomyces humidus]
MSITVVDGDDVALFQGVTMRMRNAAAACAGLAALTSLTGCTVPSAGLTGITVTEDGRPVGVLMVCHDHIDGALLYTDSAGSGRDAAEEGGSEDAGRWSSSKPVTGFASWPLTTGGQGWRVDGPMPATLQPRRTYHLFGGTDDDSWSTADVSFTPEQLAALAPGQVRYFAGDVRGADDEGYVTGTIAQFRAACRDD